MRGTKMKKIKLFRKGRFVGLVKEDFHHNKSQEEVSVWKEIGLNQLN